jgi:hypothetical protein
MVRSPSETQSCDLYQTRIDHEVENVQQTHHLQALQTNHQKHDLLQQIETHHKHENQTGPPAASKPV